jgi:hypothetical protein
VFGDERRLAIVEGEREVPVLADDEGDLQAPGEKDLRDLDADEPAADDHGPQARPGLAVQALEIAQRDEVVQAGAGRARPGRRPRARAYGQSRRS